MIDLKKEIVSLLKGSSSPFLFLGSGFSKRYIGLPDWNGLLSVFAKNSNDYARLKSSAGSDLPLTAKLLGEDFHDRWWSEPEYEESRNLMGQTMQNKTSALRFEISKYLLNLTKSKNYLIQEEVAILKTLNMDGIITTNWDNFLEGIFPDYTVYTGQNELLFSNSQGISEIYKIHGCATKPESLVLTSDDYENFNQLNPYLASKLMTLFVEHPIIFIGYSLDDSNIRTLLHSISKVLDQKKLDKLSKNLIFLRRSKGSKVDITQSVMYFEGGNIPVTIIQSDDFMPVYQALSEVKRKIPVKYLRIFQEELYEIVKSTEPSHRLFVVDEEKIGVGNNIEFIVGIGVAAERVGAFGYKGIKPIDVFEDLIFGKKRFIANVLLKDYKSSIAVGVTYIPVFKYLQELGIVNSDSYAGLEINLEKHLPKNGVLFYQDKGYKITYERRAKNLSAKEIIEKFPSQEAVKHLIYLPKSSFDLDLILAFLDSNFQNLKSEQNKYATYYRKLACLYDWRRYGNWYAG